MVETELVQQAKRLEAQTQISLYDLSVALLLENFSWAFLAASNYRPLRRRNIMPSLDVQLHQFMTLLPEALGQQVKDGHSLTPMQCKLYPDIAEALALVGAAVTRRHRLITRMNMVANLVFGFSAILHLSVLIMIVVSLLQFKLWMGVSFFMLWLLASLIAWYICLTDRHWRSHEGVRRTS